jgi:hypothetical protein
MEFLPSGYLNQTDTNSCGPIATFNAEIFQGKRYTDCGWNVLGPRRYMLNTRHNNFPVRGTLPEDMSRVLSELGVSNYKTTDTTKMKYSLEKGDALILLVSYDDNVVPGCRIHAHYLFVYSDSGRIYVVNSDRKYFTKWNTFNKKYLLNNPSDAEGNRYPVAWIVPKGNNV